MHQSSGCKLDAFLQRRSREAATESGYDLINGLSATEPLENSRDFDARVLERGSPSAHTWCRYDVLAQGHVFIHLSVLFFADHLSFHCSPPVFTART